MEIPWSIFLKYIIYISSPIFYLVLSIWSKKGQEKSPEHGQPGQEYNRRRGADDENHKRVSSADFYQVSVFCLFYFMCDIRIIVFTVCNSNFFLFSVCDPSSFYCMIIEFVEFYCVILYMSEIILCAIWFFFAFLHFLKSFSIFYSTYTLTIFFSL